MSVELVEAGEGIYETLDAIVRAVKQSRFDIAIQLSRTAAEALWDWERAVRAVENEEECTREKT